MSERQPSCRRLRRSSRGIDDFREYCFCKNQIKLSDHYSVVRLEDACQKALTFTPSPSLKSVQAILKSEQDLLQTEDVDPEPVPQKAHRFTRGAEYYRRGKK